VAIPQVERFTTVLPFPGRSVTGTVTDRTGKPVEAARVRELIGGSLALTDAEGRFSLTGLAEGRQPVVQAEKDEEKSPAVEVVLEEGRPPAPLQLVLGQHEAPSVVIQVVDAGGAPAPNAFVFLEEAGKGQRLLTTGADGRATATLEPPLPPQVRAAAFSGGAWGFGTWMTRDAVQDGLTVAVTGIGSLTVTSAKLAGSPRVLTEGGWDLSWLLRLLGAPAALSVRQPLQLSGLPAGRYDVQLESTTVTVTVTAERAGEGVLR
jgi:hypothetical protein